MLDEDNETTGPPTPGGLLFRGHLACSHGRVGCISCNKRTFCVHLWTKCRCAEGGAVTTRWEGEPAPVLADDDDRSHHPLKFRFVPLDLAHLAAEECTRSVLGAWVMPRQLLAPHLDEPVTLAWIAPNANPAWNHSRAASHPELDAIETMLLAKRGDVVATVWRVHLLAARVRRDLWAAEDARGAGSGMPEIIGLPRGHVDGLLQALACVSRLSLDRVRQDDVGLVAAARADERRRAAARLREAESMVRTRPFPSHDTGEILANLAIEIEGAAARAEVC